MDPPSYFPARDDVSIHSNAPSYTSTILPTYDALEPSPPLRSQNHTQQYSSLLSTGPLPENYHIASWPSLTGSGHQNRAYANVAARRARRDEAAREMQNVVRVLRGGVQSERRVEEGGAKELEVEEEEVNIETEGKSWDCLMVQMADSKEKEKSWNEFKKRYEKEEEKKKKKNGRRIFGKLS